MPTQSHGRVCLALALCLAVFILVLKLQHDGRSNNAFVFANQYSHSKNTLQGGISNATLGFEKIFVINGPWRTDRKDSMSLAASYSGINIDWMDGVEAENIREKAYPPGNHRGLSDGLKGCWRAHMNALREVVEKNLTTALIMEDDADWDFRIRSQLSSVSPAIRRIPNLVAQPDIHTSTYPPASGSQLSQVELEKRSSFSLPGSASRSIPKDDPYGRDWDILWLGHCGARPPPPSPHSPNRIMIPNDATVPEPQYLKPMANAPLDTIGSLYPPHTRLVHQANTTLCMIAYAVTQSGARKMLYEFGIRDFSKGYDFELSDYCNGLRRSQKDAREEQGKSEREVLPVCVVVNPPVFGHYFADKAGSDITGVGSGGKPQRESRYVKWSVRMNLERLVRGEEGLVEQWVDTMGK